jgi:hypothetical protein
MAGEDIQLRTGLLPRRTDRHHWVMHQPGELLTSGQVTLRRWRAADAPAVYQAVMESLEHLRPTPGSPISTRLRPRMR